MFFLQPTPSPIPPALNQALDRITNSLDIATQQGAIGVLLLFGVVAVILSAWLFLRTYVARNKPNEESILAKILVRTEERLTQSDSERRAATERFNEQAAEAESRYIKFGTGFSEALKYWADEIKRQGEINGHVSETLEALSIREGNQDGKITSIHETIKQVQQRLIQVSDKIEKLTFEHASTCDIAIQEMRGVAVAVNATLEQLNKKKTDTAPLPIIVDGKKEPLA